MPKKSLRAKKSLPSPNNKRRLARNILQLIPSKARQFDMVILMVALTSIALRFLIPANIVTNSPHDDLLGVQLAHNILSGNWLGQWDNRTLLKPAGYSMFLVLAKGLSIAPHILLHFLFIFLFFYLVHLLKNLLSYNPFSVLIQRITFFAFALNPALYSGDFSRIYRLSLNTFFALFFILLIFHLFIKIYNNSANRNLRDQRIETKLSILIGIAYSGMVLTRSEAVWVLIPAIILFTYVIVKELRGESRSKIRVTAKRFTTLSLIALLSYLVPVTIVKETNRKYYGVAILENYYSSEFARAFSLWTGVEGSTKNVSFIPINKSQRERVYQISPTALAMKQYLETPPNTGWKIFNCNQSGFCDETGPWFPFELRDVATSVFNVKSEVEFQQVFRQIADDIQKACERQTIGCKRTGTETGTLNILDVSKRMIINDLGIYLSSLISLDQANDVARRDGGSDPKQLAMWSSVVDVDRLFMSNDKEMYLVLGDFLIAWKKVYGIFYGLLFLITVCFLFCKPLRNAQARVMHTFQVFLSLVIGTYGLGMAIFHSATNVSSGNSFYTQPIAPIFCFFLVCGLVGMVLEINSRVSSRIENKSKP